MATMLELPRELYLEICSYLEPKDLTHLARLSRDHYLAVQQPLFRHVSVYSYKALVKLHTTILTIPVVSHISPKQRLRWYKLSDAELRERDVKSLSIQLDCCTDKTITGAILERCINGIARKCPDVSICLTLNSLWRNGIRQLEASTLANVKKLIMFANPWQMDVADKDLLLKHKLWELVFTSSTFPDLKDVYITTAAEPPLGGLALARVNNFGSIHRSNYNYGYSNKSTLSGDNFHGLLRMETVKLEYNDLLTTDVLNALFNSSIIPKRLTTLEIVNCPHIHPVKDLAAIATLLQRGLQLLKSLKLHLAIHNNVFSYNAEIDEATENHLCDIVREIGQKIQSLDLAIPFACKHIFCPKATKLAKYRAPLELPTIPQEPLNTLPARLNKAGYKYRRLILCNGICHGAHATDELVDLAVAQEGSTSWEILDVVRNRATWCVSSCLPVEFAWEEVLAHPLRDE